MKGTTLRRIPEDRKAPRRGVWWSGWLFLFGTVVLGVALIGKFPEGARRHFWFVMLAAALGALAGGSEVVSRYRDEPMLALTSRSGITYLAMNASVSALTYGLLTQYAASILPSVGKDRLVASIVAGLGAMAILRSKFFSLRTETGEDISIGPDAVVSAFLDAADRGIDRARAARRLDLVFRYAETAKHPEKGRDFLQISIAAFQNLEKDLKSQFVERLDLIAQSQYPDRLKLQAICYELLGLTGEANFRDIMQNLEKYGDHTDEA
jgi:hypothetical protein